MMGSGRARAHLAGNGFASDLLGGPQFVGRLRADVKARVLASSSVDWKALAQETAR